MSLTSTRALAIIRIAIGVIFLWRTRGPVVGWPDARFHIALFALPVWLVAALVIVRTIAALAFTAGVRAREAGILASVAGYVVLSQDALAYVNTLQLLFVSTFILAITDSSCELALRPVAPRAPTSSVWLVRAICLSVYAFSGIAKLNAQFLSGRALLWFHDDGLFRGPIAELVCANARRAQFASIAVVCAELSLPLLLVAPRTRRAALYAAVAFHVVLELTVHPDVFGWIMAALLASFAITSERAR